MQNQFSLLTHRRFLPFFITQMLGAFNDNVFKQSLILLLVFHARTWSHLSAPLLTNLCAALFILPFFLFSATAGQLADRLEKTRIIRWIKIIELFLMLLASYGLFRHQLTLLLFTLFMMGTHSTFFGPAKYALLPYVLHETELIGGNALVETGTSLAILIGSMVGGILAADTSTTALCLTLTVVAGAGILSSWWIPVVGYHNPGLNISLNPFREIVHTVRFVRQHQPLWIAMIGASWFWFFGAVLLTQLPSFSHDILHANEHSVTVLMTLFSVGIAIGSLLCERLSRHRIEPGLVLLGGCGLVIASIGLFLSSLRVHTPIMINVPQLLKLHPDLILSVLGIGISGGVYIVPLYALMQFRAPPSHRSRVIAANNILNAGFMVASAVAAVLVLGPVHGTIVDLFLANGLMTLLILYYMQNQQPEYSQFLRNWFNRHP